MQLHAVARDLLARRRLQEMRRQMRYRETALAAVAFDAQGRDLDLLDGLQQLRRPAAIPKGVHGVFPADGVLQLCLSSGRGGVFLFVIDGVALRSALAFFFQPPRGRLRWSSSQLVPRGCTHAPLSFRWAPWDPGGCTRARSVFEGRPRSKSTIEKFSLFRLRIIT
jgi:hypothetical protein